MKGLAVILISAMVSVLWGGEIPSRIKGTWVVKEYRFAGTSAVSEKEANSWIGKTLVIGEMCVSLERVTNSSPRFRYALHYAETYFVEGFRIKQSAVGYEGLKVREYEVMQADGKAWVEPGSTLLILSGTEALTWWDGVFFVLERREAQYANWFWSRELPKEVATESPASNRTAVAVDELFKHGSPPLTIDKVVAALGKPDGFSRQALYSKTQGTAQPQKVGGTLRFLLGGGGELLVRTGDFHLIYEAIRYEKGGRANLLTK